MVAHRTGGDQVTGQVTARFDPSTRRTGGFSPRIAADRRRLTIVDLCRDAINRGLVSMDHATVHSGIRTPSELWEEQTFA